MPTTARRDPLTGPDPSTSRTRRRGLGRRALTVTFAVGLAAGVVLSCSSDPEGPPPDEAADVVTGGFGLGTDVRQCLVERFDADPSAAAALAVGGAAPMDQRRALQDVLGTCISDEALAGVIAVGVGAGVPGTDDARQTCLETAVLDLDAEQRALLLVGLALSGDGTPDQLDVDLGAITSELFEACDVAVSADPEVATSDDGGSPPSAPSTTSAP